MKPINQILTVSIDTLRELPLKDLFERLKDGSRDVANRKIEIGKMLFVLDAQRPEKGTLRGYVRKEVGIEIEPASYQAAKAFDFVGEGHGSITETQFDACALNWLVTMSAIVGLLENEPDEIKGSIREQVAEAVRNPNTKTGEVLKTIKDLLKPAPAKTEKENAAYEKAGKEAQGNADQEAADSRNQLSPEQFLGAMDMPTFFTLLLNVTRKKDVAELGKMAAGYNALLSYCQVAGAEAPAEKATDARQVEAIEIAAAA